MRRSWLVWGWAVALLAAALPAAWLAYGLATRNPMGLYVDPVTGQPTARLFRQFLRWWMSGAVPVSALAMACLFVNRPAD